MKRPVSAADGAAVATSSKVSASSATSMPKAMPPPKKQHVDEDAHALVRLSFSQVKRKMDELDESPMSIKRMRGAVDLLLCRLEELLDEVTASSTTSMPPPKKQKQHVDEDAHARIRIAFSLVQRSMDELDESPETIRRIRGAVDLLLCRLENRQQRVNRTSSQCGREM